MGAISQTNVKFVGSHCGVSIGEDGPSQMGLEDLALFRSVPKSIVFYPSDAVCVENAVELAAKTKGICYIRTSRPNTPIIYKNNEKFEIGQAKVIYQSENDQILIISGGVTVHEALKAAKELKNDNISVRVIDLFTVKPIDKDAILLNAKQCDSKIITVEDHYAEGGLGEAVLSVVAEERGIFVKKLAVTDIPRSGTPAELLDYYNLSAKSIIKVVKKLI